MTSVAKGQADLAEYQTNPMTEVAYDRGGPCLAGNSFGPVSRKALPGSLLASYRHNKSSHVITILTADVES